MKIVVAIKRVVNFAVKIRINKDNSGIDTANLKMGMNPFCEIAVEEALKIIEKKGSGEVTVVSIGNEKTEEILRHALAMGAHHAIHVQTEKVFEPLEIAKILKEIIKNNPCDLVLLGKQAIDGDNNQTGQLLAGLLNWPQGTFVSSIQCGEKEIEVTREIDGGLETLLLVLPAVVTTDLRLNTPRYASLPNIMKAKRKTIEKTTLEQLGLSLESKITTISLDSPPIKKPGIILSSVDELVEKLRHEAKVI